MLRHSTFWHKIVTDGFGLTQFLVPCTAWPYRFQGVAQHFKVAMATQYIVPKPLVAIVIFFVLVLVTKISDKDLACCTNLACENSMEIRSVDKVFLFLMGPAALSTSTFITTIPPILKHKMS